MVPPPPHIPRPVALFSLLFLLSLLSLLPPTAALVPLRPPSSFSRLPPPLASSPDASPDEESLRRDLREYLSTRERNVAAGKENPRFAKRKKGGTRGNPVLEYVSAATGEIEMDEAESRGVFDYDELSFHGYDRLVRPIMRAGGRRYAYALMDMTPPAPPARLRRKVNPDIKLDLDGESVKERYDGLKVGRSLDEEMSRAMDSLSADGKNKIRDQLEADRVYLRRRDGPKMTPEWTAASLDEAGAARGRAESWARETRAKAVDPSERLRLEGAGQLYLALTALFSALGFGRATPAALEMAGGGSAEYLQVAALVMVFLAVGSAGVAAAVLAPGKNRDQVVWGIKGLLGGPVVALQLQGLDSIESKDS